MLNTRTTVLPPCRKEIKEKCWKKKQTKLKDNHLNRKCKLNLVSLNDLVLRYRKESPHLVHNWHINKLQLSSFYHKVTKWWSTCETFLKSQAELLTILGGRLKSVQNISVHCGWGSRGLTPRAFFISALTAYGNKKLLGRKKLREPAGLEPASPCGNPLMLTTSLLPHLMLVALLIISFKLH